MLKKLFARMSNTNRLLIALYALTALAALIATWSQNLIHFAQGRSFPIQYLEDLKFTAAARSFSVDLGFLLLACVGFMVAEARRLKIPFVWLYVFMAFAIAISVTFPLFLIARHVRLAKVGVPEASGRLTAGDWIGLGLVTVSVGYMTWFVLG